MERYLHLGKVQVGDAGATASEYGQVVERDCL